MILLDRLSSTRLHLRKNLDTILCFLHIVSIHMHFLCMVVFLLMKAYAICSTLVEVTYEVSAFQGFVHNPFHAIRQHGESRWGLYPGEDASTTSYTVGGWPAWGLYASWQEIQGTIVQGLQSCQFSRRGYLSHWNTNRILPKWFQGDPDGDAGR